ncbi:MULTISPECIES: SDR family NAD(P)-dependent oxidoreductase [Roseobacteraceae]|uniref:3-oxoacyl-[acyl-carrier-protein] reductase FabG n=1 Tax=Pseudosulfitobacter pseudonitzschiae TaxID=1402135 RepID=A0A221K7Z8_9RHOB|nr:MULTISPECIES: 3-oxoacyl-ACP reductase family protein [Roseobacteraceae]ASM75124.1 3-oxoacyl-[acyl-carrier-protein] reductase FabG [Pseudosulfitobacter pseudonitzschiae]
MNGTRSLTGKVALVTGGSRGIGAEVARRLASDGAEVVIAYRSDKASAQNVVEVLIAAGAKAHAFLADIAIPEDCEKLIGDCIKACGRLDILVNAAGVAAYHPLDQVDADHFHAMFNTNVLGALSLTRAFAAVMDGPGQIIHFASRLAETPMPNTSVYAASKAAVSAMTLALSQELGPRGITINAIAPGLIETDMTAAAVSARGEAMRNTTPLRRIGQPKDISGIVSFLASDDARWITGKTIRADGGLL